MTTTTRLRDLMKQLSRLQAEHHRQWNCPSRGYDEDRAISEMTRIEDEIENELDHIDSVSIGKESHVG